MTSVHPCMAWFSGAGGVRLKAEGQYGEVTVDGSEQIGEVTLEMQRGKLALELSQGFRTGTGNEMAFVLESALGAPQHAVGVRGRLRFR